MSRPRVYAARRVTEPVRAELERLFDLQLHDNERPPDREALLAGCAGADGVLVTLSDRVDDELLDAAGPQLRVVANHAVGYDNVDLEAASRRGIVVANTPDVLTHATAELAVALMLDLLRRVTEGDRLVHAGRDWIWAPTFMLGRSLRGRVVGVVGLGRIGREVARLAEAHGATVVYAGPSEQPDVPYERLPLEELLARADIVTLHCPLTPRTRHLIGTEALERMRPSEIGRAHV